MSVSVLDFTVGLLRSLPSIISKCNEDDLALQHKSRHPSVGLHSHCNMETVSECEPGRVFSADYAHAHSSTKKTVCPVFASNILYIWRLCTSAPWLQA
jgi:hypothetical protein